MVTRVRGSVDNTFDTVQEMKDAVGLIVGDLITVKSYTATNNSGVLQFEIVPAATGTDDGLNYFDLPASGLQARQVITGTPKVTQAGFVGDGVTANGVLPESALFLPNQETYLVSETVLSNNNSLITGTGTLVNNTVNQHIVSFGEKQSGADAKYSYATAKDITLSNNSVHTDDNWATVNSSADKTKYTGITVKDSYVGLSFNKNYNYSVAANSAVTFGVCTSNLVKARFMGIEHFGTKAVATVGNSVECIGNAGPAYRFTGDLDTPSYANGLNPATGASNGLTIQTQTIANNLVGYAFADCTNGFSIPENTTIANGSSRCNITEFTADDCTYGAFTYNTQYQWVRGVISNATSGGWREENTTGASGIGDLKSNKIDLLVYSSATGAALKSSHNEITINASDITFNCLTIDGDHNIVKLICDKANTVASTNRALVLNGAHNVVDVISTGNTAIGSSGDILVAGDKNYVRATTDAAVRITGNNNTVVGYAASTIDVGTGNDVTGVKVY